MRVGPSLLAVFLGWGLAACQPAQPPAAGGSDAAPAAPEPGAGSTVDTTEGDGSAGTAAFRATGNEPGWLAIVDGDTPGLQVDVDYGERHFDVASPTKGADGWSGKASDGTDVKLSFQRTTCQDDMSGEAFDAKVMLTVGTRQYHGCGNFGATRP